ncbi:MAG: hypothetical protein J6Y91_05330, partial [Alphaproteobacteria bacterium]|nr:hypothetical protein [Alphaproteobacteria bacterium]
MADEEEKKQPETTVSTNTEYSSRSEDEENPILVAQRYLNIFHQLHVFSDEKKQEFNESILQIPFKIRKLLPAIPGGKIFLEYLRDIQTERGIHDASMDILLPRHQDMEEIQKAAEIQEPVASPVAAAPIAVAAPVALGNATVNLSPNFAQNLAVSLADALKNSNLLPSGSNQNLTEIFNKSFSTYSANLQQMAAILTDIQKNSAFQADTLQTHLKEQSVMQGQLQTQLQTHLKAQTQLQSQLQSQLHSQTQLQEQLQNQMQNQTQLQAKLQDQMQNQTQLQAQLQNQLQTQTNMQTQLQSQITQQLAAAVSPAALNAAALNTQQNMNTNSTTVNNINIDSSSFSALTEALQKNSERSHEDLKEITSVLNKNLATNKTDDVTIKLLANTIADTMKENSRQQMKAIKEFGELLSKSIIQSQKELVKNFRQSTPDKVYVPYIPEGMSALPADIDISKSDFSKIEGKGQKKSFMEKISKGIEKINDIKNELTAKNVTNSSTEAENVDILPHDEPAAQKSEPQSNDKQTKIVEAPEKMSSPKDNNKKNQPRAEVKTDKKAQKTEDKSETAAQNSKVEKSEEKMKPVFSFDDEDDLGLPQTNDADLDLANLLQDTLPAPQFEDALAEAFAETPNEPEPEAKTEPEPAPQFEDALADAFAE